MMNLRWAVCVMRTCLQNSCGGTAREMRTPRKSSQRVLYSGIHLRRDNWASVRYAEGLNSSKSSVTLRSTDRHDILGQKSAGFQLSLGERYAECAPDCPQDGLVQKQCPSSHAGYGAAGTSSGVLVVGNGGRPPVVDSPGGRHALHVWSQTRCGDGHAERVFRSPAS